MFMNEMKRRKTMRLKTADYNQPGRYFFTLCTKKRECILSRVVAENPLEEPTIQLLPYGKIVEKYIEQLQSFYGYVTISRYVIMPNHIHLLILLYPISDKEEQSQTVQNSVLSRFLSTFKRFCNKECGENIWQNRSYDHIIRSEQDYEKHLNYICANPTNW